MRGVTFRCTCNGEEGPSVVEKEAGCDDAGARKEKADWKHHEWRSWAGRPGWMHPGAEQGLAEQTGCRRPETECESVCEHRVPTCVYPATVEQRRQARSVLPSQLVAGAKIAELQSASQNTVLIGQRRELRASEGQDAKRHSTTWTTESPHRAIDQPCVIKEKTRKRTQGM